MRRLSGFYCFQSLWRPLQTLKCCDSFWKFLVSKHLHYFYLPLLATEIWGDSKSSDWKIEYWLFCANAIPEKQVIKVFIKAREKIKHIYSIPHWIYSISFTTINVKKFIFIHFLLSDSFNKHLIQEFLFVSKKFSLVMCKKV